MKKKKTIPTQLVRDDYFQFLGLRTSYKDFDISNYLNFRKI